MDSTILIFCKWLLAVACLLVAFSGYSTIKDIRSCKYGHQYSNRPKKWVFNKEILWIDTCRKCKSTKVLH